MAKKKKQHVIDAGELQSFHEEFAASRQEIADLASHHSEILKRMEERGYNRAAFKQVAKLLGWDVHKAQDWKRAFDQYSEILGLNEMLESQGDLIDEKEEAEAKAAAG